MVSVQHALVELGIVTRVVTSFAGENFPVGATQSCLPARGRGGSREVESWSLWSLIARLAAGALGVSHFPVRSMSRQRHGASRPARRGELVEVDVDGERLALVSHAAPDVTVLHGVVADAAGNVVLSPPYGEAAWGSLASRRGVIACVEKVVAHRGGPRHNVQCRIPAHKVLAVCEVPFGAHPFALYNPGLPRCPVVRGGRGDGGRCARGRAAPQRRSAAGSRSG